MVPSLRSITALVLAASLVLAVPAERRGDTDYPSAREWKNKGLESRYNFKKRHENLGCDKLDSTSDQYKKCCQPLPKDQALPKECDSGCSDASSPTNATVPAIPNATDPAIKPTDPATPSYNSTDPATPNNNSTIPDSSPNDHTPGTDNDGSGDGGDDDGANKGDGGHDDKGDGGDDDDGANKGDGGDDDGANKGDDHSEGGDGNDDEDCDEDGDGNEKSTMTSTTLPEPTSNAKMASSGQNPDESYNSDQGDDKEDSEEDSEDKNNKESKSNNDDNNKGDKGDKGDTNDNSDNNNNSDNSDTGEVITGGYATFYEQEGEAGACGELHSDDDLIGAMDYRRYGDIDSVSPLCGRKVKITNPANKKTVEVTIKDVCPTCKNGNSIDLSHGAYFQIGTEEEGMFPIEWSYI